MTIITITGPSCAGKSTLEEKLTKIAGFEKIISHTTRKPRLLELNGREYFFIDNSEFKRLEVQGFFAEHVEFNGNRYGASKSQFKKLIELGRHPVVVVEPKGRDEILAFAKSEGIPAMAVYLNTPKEVIAERFVERVVADFIGNISKPGAGAGVIDAYSQRLTTMLTTEQQWQANCVNAQSLVFDRYDKTNEARVHEIITSQAEYLAGAKITA